MLTLILRTYYGIAFIGFTFGIYCFTLEEIEWAISFLLFSANSILSALAIKFAAITDGKKK